MDEVLQPGGAHIGFADDPHVEALPRIFGDQGQGFQQQTTPL
jgi:hypothetical protein